MITILLLIVIVGWGIFTAPFNWFSDIPRDPVPVDAIPDLGDNQQIVATEWMGRSPKDIEDQISYPLTTSLLGIPGVKTIRSTSMFGMSFIYIIFEEDIEFYWSRSRKKLWHKGEESDTSRRCMKFVSTATKTWSCSRSSRSPALLAIPVGIPVFPEIRRQCGKRRVDYRRAGAQRSGRGGQGRKAEENP